MNTLYSVLLIFNCIVAFLPVRHGEKRVPALIFSLSACSISFWIYCNYWIFHSTNILLWNRLAYMAASSIAAFLLFFVLIYPKKSIAITPKTIILLFSFPILFVCLSMTSFIVKSMPSVHQVEFGIGQYWFIAYFIVYIGLVFGIALRRILQYQGQDKIKLQYFLYSLLFSVMFGATANLFLPTIGITQFYSVGPLFASIFIYSMLYTMLKHDLLNMKLAVSRSLSSFLTCIIFLIGL